MAPRVTFPLPDHYFRPVELTKQDEMQFQAWAMALVEETLTGLHQDQYMTHEQRERKWKALKKSGGLTAYRRRKGSEEEGDEYRYLCTGKIEGALDEIMMGRYADTTDSFRRMSAVYREDLVDCMVLHTIETQSVAKPFFFCGFKWMTVKSPGKGIVKNRDVCWFEQSGLTVDHNGKEIGYHIAQSVDLASCPTFDEAVCVRARLSACYLFRRNKSGGTKVFMRGKNNAGGKVMDWVADLKSAELWLRTERAKMCAMAYVSTEMVRAALPADSPHVLGTNNRCEVCAEKTATMMTSQKECSVCHRITCSRCVIKRRVLSSARDFLQDEKELFCKRCVRFFHDIKYRDPQSIAMVCAAAASRCEPLGGTSLSTSGYSHTYSHSSQASSSSSDSVREPMFSHSSSASSGSNNNLGSQRGGGGAAKQLPPPSAQLRIPRQDSNRSNRVVLYPEIPMEIKELVTASSSSSSSRGKKFRPMADSDASTVASSVASHRTNNFQSYVPSNHSSFASEYEYSDSESGYGSADSSMNKSFQRHLMGSVPGHFSHHHNNNVNHMVRLDSTDELSPPPRADAGTLATRTGPYNTPEDMMAQMVRMNIMAEQARQMVKDNDKFTRKFNFY